VFDFTPEEKKVTIFLLALAFCGLLLNSLVKVNCRLLGIISPQIHLARLNLNQASLADLLETRRVSASLARRIIEYRSSTREFSSLEELRKIKGIGPARYEKIKDLFFIE